MSGSATALAPAFLIIMMFAIGLQVELRTMVSDVRKYRLMAKALLANLVLAPLLGIALVYLFRLKGEIAAGFLLLALAPGAPFAINFTSKAQGAVSFAASLLFVLVVVALIFTPLIANLLLPAQTHVSLPYGRAIWGIVLLLIIPFAVGLAVRNEAERLAGVLCGPATVLALILFVGFMVLSASAGKQARSAIGGHTVLAMLAFIVAAMLIGWLLGGPEHGNRQVMAVGTSMRNVAVALPLVQSLGSEAARLVVIAFFSLMVPCNLLLTVYEAVMQKRRAASPRSA